MKIIAISWPTFFSGEADIINSLFRNGLELLHIRKPDATEEAVSSLLDEIDAQYYDRVAIHYHHRLAERYGLGGVHLSGRCPVAPANWRGRVSMSCHSIEEVRLYGAKNNYVFLSPIFDSISKEGYKSAFSIEELQEAKSEGVINSNIIALGGIKKENLMMVRELGFGGVAVLGNLWGNLRKDSVLRRFFELKDEAYFR